MLGYLTATGSLRRFTKETRLMSQILIGFCDNRPRRKCTAPIQDPVQQEEFQSALIHRILHHVISDGTFFTRDSFTIVG